MKKILVLGAGIYNVQVYRKLAEAGFYTIAMDGNVEAPAASAANEFVHLNFADKQLLLNYCNSNRVDGILPINDWGTKPAAFVTTQLNLPGITETAALNATDKGFMRDVWKQHHLPVPKYFVFSTLSELIDRISDVGFPCVIKPTDSGGSGRGISVLQSENDLQWAYDFAAPFVKNNRFICEEFIPGLELTIESISIEGNVHILAISDKEKPELKTRVATSLNYSANISEEVKNTVKEICKRAVIALGINVGMAHTEMIVNDNGVFLVETGARGGGGHIFHTIIEAVSGLNAPVLAAKLLTGQAVTIDETDILERGSVYRFFNPKTGILKSIHGLEEAKKIPGVLDLGMIKKIGDEVGNLKNSLERAGHVITAGINRQEAVELANRVEEMVQFEIDIQS